MRSLLLSAVCGDTMTLPVVRELGTENVSRLHHPPDATLAISLFTVAFMIALS